MSKVLFILIGLLVSPALHAKDLHNVQERLGEQGFVALDCGGESLYINDRGTELVRLQSVQGGRLLFPERASFLQKTPYGSKTATIGGRVYHFSQEISSYQLEPFAVAVTDARGNVSARICRIPDHGTMNCEVNHDSVVNHESESHTAP